MPCDLKEYHFFEDRWLEVLFDTTTDKLKSSKERFTFVLGNQLQSYHQNSKTKPDDFSYGEFETSINYDSVGQLYYCNIGFNNISKKTSTIKQGYHFYCGKLNSFFEDFYAKEKGENYDCDTKIMLQYRSGKPEVGYINYHVTNEKPSYDFKHEF